MSISGAVVVLSGDASEAPETVRALRANPAITVGASNLGPRVPITIETDASMDGRRVVRWIEAHPEVVHVEVVFVDFGDDAPPRQDKEHDQ